MKFSPLALVLCLVSASCATTHSQDSAKEASADVAQNKADSANKVECEASEPRTGSHMARRRCVTKEQKKQEEKDAQEFLSRMPGPSAPKGGVGP